MPTCTHPVIDEYGRCEWCGQTVPDVIDSMDDPRATPEVIQKVEKVVASVIDKVGKTNLDYKEIEAVYWSCLKIGLRVGQRLILACAERVENRGR